MGSVKTKELVSYIDALINSKPVDDYCHNGLQLEGADSVSRIITGVTLCSELIEAAIDVKAEAILVHHGLFWKGDEMRLHGMRRQRLKALLQHDIAVLAYHLPLDFHPEYGNNALLAKGLGLVSERVLGKSGVLVARVPNCHSIEALTNAVEQLLGQKPHVALGNRESIATVGICSGGADRYFELAVDAGCDAYITGDAGISCFHSARETGSHFLAAGHHATERLGVRALGEHLAAQFSLQHRFVDVENPF